MIERLRAAWAALCGGLVLSGHGWVVVFKSGDGTHTVRWDHVKTDEAATLLYQAADAMVERINGHSTIH